MPKELLYGLILILNIYDVSCFNTIKMMRMSMPLNRREFVQISSGFALSNVVLNNEQSPICIIGANGESGRECLKLLDESKQPVKAFSRKPINYDELGIINKDLIQNINFDLKNKEKLKKEMKGVSSVIFLANAKKKYRYYKSDTDEFQNYEDIDIYSLKNVVSNCIEYKIPRLIYVSASCRSCNEYEGTTIDKICGIECENCNTKQTAEKIIRNAYENQSGMDYTIVRVGYLINGENRGANEIEINQDYTKSGMISRIDLANICLNSITDKNTARTTFEAYYRDTTQPYDVKESLRKCRNLGKSVEECFFGSSFKDSKPKDLEDVRNTPIKGSLFTTGKEYNGETWNELFKDLKKDNKNNNSNEDDNEVFTDESNIQRI